MRSQIGAVTYRSKSMDTFKLKIELGNDAMQTPEDVADALEKVVRDLRNGVRNRNIYDENGNKVGEFHYE